MTEHAWVVRRKTKRDSQIVLKELHQTIVAALGCVGMVALEDVVAILNVPPDQASGLMRKLAGIGLVRRIGDGLYEVAA